MRSAFFHMVLFSNSTNDIDLKKGSCMQKNAATKLPKLLVSKRSGSTVQMSSNERRENKFCQIGMNYLIEQSHRSHTFARHPCRYTITVHSK